jgi:hypothetical protein
VGTAHPKAFNPMSEESAPALLGGHSGWKQVVAGLGLLAVLAWLGTSNHWLLPVREAFDVSRWFNGDVTLGRVVTRLLVGGLLEAAAFAASGGLAVVALHPRLARLQWPARYGVVLGSGLLLAFLVRSAQLGRWPEGGNLVPPLLAWMFGAILGRAVALGQRAWVSLAIQLGTATLLVGILVLVAAQWAIERAPLAWESEPNSEVSLRTLADKLRGVRGGAEEGRLVVLEEQDLNRLISIAAARLAPTARGRVSLARDALAAEASLPLPGGTRRFVNLRFRGAARVEDGRLTLRGEQLSLGALPVPRLVLWLLSGPVSSALNHDRDLQIVIGSIASLRLEPAAAEIAFWPGEFNNSFVPALALAVTGRTSVAAQTRAQVRYLVESAGDLPSGDDRLLELLRRAFTFAQARSVEGDPVEENRAALLALAILLGHPQVETVVGPVFDEPLRAQAARDLTGTTLRGRADWTKHFTLSAGMVAKACEGVSDRVGLVKELRDAAGGSGFSFGDMAANRAGIRLAQAATFNAAAARAVQQRWAEGVTCADLFPEVADLPEDLAAAEFQARFGSVTDPRYLELIAEIDRRLMQCAALQP